MSKSKNRLGGVWGATSADDVLEPEPMPPAKPTTKPEPQSQPATIQQSEPKPVQQIERGKVGRPPGKRTNPDFQSVTTFLRKDTYLAVQRALVGSGQDFGDVVDTLLADWLKRNP